MKAVLRVAPAPQSESHVGHLPGLLAGPFGQVSFAHSCLTGDGGVVYSGDEHSWWSLGEAS